MITRNFFILVITECFYSTSIVTLASDCVSLPQSCDIQRNATANATVFGQKDKLLQIDSTLKAVAEASAEECLSAIQALMCISATQTCNNTTTLGNLTQQCRVVQQNCSSVIATTYGSQICPQIQGYSESECVEVVVTGNGYCPNDVEYKVFGENVNEFLRNASFEKEKSQTIQKENISDVCLRDFRRIHCYTFVPSCPNTTTITRSSCEQRLQCLPSNSSSFNKTLLCSQFPDHRPTTANPTTTQAATTTYDLARGFNTTVTVRLNTKFQKEYSNKSSSLYKSFASDVASGLKTAYTEVTGFEGVVIEALVCREEVAVKHTVVTRVETTVSVLTAALTVANQTTNGGYLEGKVVQENEVCLVEDGHADRTDSDDWVYMIVFVCVTALLLLAMVLCHQSK